jgi:hypothetical protein
MRIVLAEILSRLIVHGTGRPIRIVRRGFTFSPSSGLPIRVERFAG